MSDDPASAAAFRHDLEMEIERLRAERDEIESQRNAAWLRAGRIFNEIDCRIEHGADSNGHLEAIRSLFKED